MSRIGANPIEVPDGVTVEISDRTVTVKGKLGEMERTLPEGLSAVFEDKQIVLSRLDDTREQKSFHGLMRSLVANMVEGVSKGYTRELEIQGVGFKAAVQGQTVSLSLGFASPIEYGLPDGITVTEQGGTKVTITGIDKQVVGDVAARIRSFFPAEPYKGKGIRYVGEQVRRKVGKTVA